MKNEQQLKPLPDSAWPADIAGTLTGPILNIHRMLAHSPELLRRSAPLRNYLVQGSRLTSRQRELLILRTADRINSGYEWAHHVVRGRAAGLTPAEIERVREGPAAPGWSQMEVSLLSLVDEMQSEQALGAETSANLQKALGNAGLIDAIFTVGYYLTLGTILKSFAVPLDESIQPLDG